MWDTIMTVNSMVGAPIQNNPEVTRLVERTHRYWVVTHRVLLILFAIELTGCVSYDKTRGKSSVCEFHHVQMTKQAVRVVPGIAAPAYDGTPHPHANREIVAGCTVPEQTGYVYVCPECDRLWRERGNSDASHR